MGGDGDRADGPRPWEREESRTIAEYEMFSVREDRSRSPKGGEAHEFQIVVSPGGVAVIALTDDGRMVMVEQFRHGTRRGSLELPSGVVDEGESPEDAAVRELREETGYEGGVPRVMGCVELNPSWQSTPVRAVLIRGVRRAGEQEEDEGEDIRVRLLPVAEVMRKVAVGEIDTAATVCALALWDWRTRELSRDG